MGNEHLSQLTDIRTAPDSNLDNRQDTRLYIANRNRHKNINQ